ncbi:MAG TPA: hypothetical protein VNK41_11705, partial [Vicinamibacterales bacterium]|nr:hypothetical protein [Vicinamibacterales bacterium]
RRKPARGKKPTAAQQDEWGLYDPAACGFEALYARLEEQERREAEEPADEPSTSDLLMEALQRGARTNGTAAKAARRTPAPLAIWARREAAPNGTAAAPAANGNGAASPNGSVSTELHAILRTLKLPPHVAEVSYAGGCRIRRIRVRARKRGKQDGAAPLIVLSRRRLAELRAQADSPER